MKRVKDQSGNVALWAVIVIAGLLIGFAVGHAAGAHNKSSTTSSDSVPTSATKAADLRANLVTLGVEHMQLTDSAVDAALDGAPNATALDTELNNNGKSLGAAVGSVYGADAEKTFDSVWQIHLDDFVKYAVADKSGDSAGQSAALKDIDTNYTHPLAAYLAKANPNLPESTLYNALSDHVTMTAQMIDDHVKGKYTDEANELDMSSQHMNELFSTLAAGIVKQYPTKF